MSSVSSDGVPQTLVGTDVGGAVGSVQLPTTGIFVVESVRAVIDTSGGDSTPTLRVLDKSREEVATKPQTTQLAGGTSESATWALRLADESPAGPVFVQPWCIATKKVFAVNRTGATGIPFANFVTSDPTFYALSAGGSVEILKQGFYAYYAVADVRTNGSIPQTHSLSLESNAGTLTSPNSGLDNPFGFAFNTNGNVINPSVSPNIQSRNPAFTTFLNVVGSLPVTIAPSFLAAGFAGANDWSCTFANMALVRLGDGVSGVNIDI